jgi:hypothetical protein
MTSHQVDITPSQFAENFLYIEKAKPFSIKKYPFFYSVYDCPSDQVLLRCSRQVGKSLSIANIQLSNIVLAEMYIDYIESQNLSREEELALNISAFHALYVAPTGKQVSTFSKQKLTLILDGSPIFKNFRTTRSSDQIAYKSFKNGSDLFCRSCFHSPDSIRGISSDMITIDEIQDIIVDHIPVILETQARSNRQINFYSGTPKTTRNTIEHYWKLSTQNEWAVKCDHCGKYNILGENNIQPKGLSCSKPSCRKLINRENGLWVRMNDDEKAYMQGFRIHAMMANFMPWTGDPGTKQYANSLMWKYENYSRAQFYNEVLGLPYDGGSIPITEAEIMEACDLSQRKHAGLSELFESGLTQNLRGRFITAGVDWGTSQEGKSRTVLSIVGYVNGKYHLIFSKIYGPTESDPTYQVEDILKWLNRFGAKLVGVDWGFGWMQNKVLAEKYGVNYGSRGRSSSVIEFFNHHSLKSRRKWDQDSLKFILNRTECMTDIFMSIKDKMILFPKWEVMKPFAEDIMNIYQEYSEQTGIMKFGHHPDQPDDFFMSLMYAIEAQLIYMRKNMIKESKSSIYGF